MSYSSDQWMIYHLSPRMYFSTFIGEWFHALRAINLIPICSELLKQIELQSGRSFALITQVALRKSADGIIMELGLWA